MTKLYFIKMLTMQKFVCQYSIKGRLSYQFSKNSCSLFNEQELQEVLSYLTSYGYDGIKVVQINGF